MGLKQNFSVLAANVPNAAAVVYRGQRYILYNPDFISRLTAAAGNRWAAVSVLAHEVGHHLNGHTLDNTGSEPGRELEADEFSGFVLRRMGATLAEAQVAMKIAANYKSSVTHPGQQQRLVAIAGGWNNADRQITGKSNIAKVYEEPVTKAPAPVITARANRETVTSNNSAGQTALAERYILGEVHFNGIKNADYFITIRNHFVRVANNRLDLLGDVVPLRNKDYPFAITADNTVKLFVGARGNIVTNTGKQVGYLTAYR